VRRVLASSSSRRRSRSGLCHRCRRIQGDDLERSLVQNLRLCPGTGGRPERKRYRTVGQSLRSQPVYRDGQTAELRCRFRTLLRRRDGSIRNCSLFASFIDKTGYRLLMAVYLDITDRKRAEEALRFNQFAIDHMADAAFWMTSDARFFYVNQAACRALGSPTTSWCR
jgi:PAS domain-containing protein